MSALAEGAGEDPMTPVTEASAQRQDLRAFFKDGAAKAHEDLDGGLIVVGFGATGVEHSGIHEVFDGVAEGFQRAALGERAAAPDVRGAGGQARGAGGGGEEALVELVERGRLSTVDGGVGHR